jgi:FKBP-type peptidyl-prolyl cis-trans isomerase SlyD
VKIAKNTVVSLQYELSDAAGSLLEKSNDPISYLHGGYDGVFPLVEEMLQGKQVGDRCVVEMEPEDAFGEYDHDLVRVEPRDLFPDNVDIGMQFEGGAEDDDDEDYLLYTVVDVNDQEVTVDGNHPFAGKALSFDCTVTDVRAATADEIAHEHVHDGHGHHH